MIRIPHPCTGSGRARNRAKVDCSRVRLDLNRRCLVVEPWDAFFQRLLPGERDDRGGDDELEDDAHSRSGLVMAFALGVHPVALAVFVGVKDVAGE